MKNSLRKLKGLHKTIIKETKHLTKRIVHDQEDNLYIKFKAKELSSCLVRDVDTKKPIARFTNDFLSFLNNFRDYSVDGSNSLNIEFAKNCDKREIELFKKAWKQHFALRLYRKNEDIKEIKRKNIFSLIFGLLALLVVVGFSVSTVIYDKQWLKITMAVVDSVFSIISWVLIWEFFYDVVYTISAMRKDLINIYIMYSCKFDNKKRR